MEDNLVSMTELRRNASEIVNRVHWTGEEIILTSKGKPMVKLIRYEEDEEGEKADK
jgi:prevent-host-death family protein